MTTENLFFSTSQQFEIVSFDKGDSLLNIKIKSIQPTSCCPNSMYRTVKYIVPTTEKSKIHLPLKTEWQLPYRQENFIAAIRNVY